MPFKQETREIRQERKTLIVAIILFINLILISSQIILRNQRSLLQTVVGNLVTPFQVAWQSGSDFVVNQWQRYFFLRGIYRRYQSLKEVQTKLKYQNFLMKKELRDLQALQGLTVQFQDYLVARVIAVDSNFPYHVVVIDRGSSQQVVENQTVINLDGDLVGRIVKPITLFSAAVRLITSSIGGAGAYLESNRLEGFVTGNGNASCTFKYLLGNRPVKVGDRVLTSGTDRLFPPFIVIGQVTAIEKDYLTQNIQVKPYFVDKPIKHLIVIRHEEKN